MRELWASVVRTIVPLLVGLVLGWLTTVGIEPDPEFAALLANVLTAAFTGLYYIAVRLLERYVDPKFGWLLGLAKEPVYDTDTAVATERRDLVYANGGTLPVPADGTGKHRAEA